MSVIRLEIDVYRQPFEWSRVATETTERAAKHKTRYGKMPRDRVRLLVSDPSQNDKAVASPMIPTNRENQDSTDRQRLQRDEARRLISGDAPFSMPSSSSAPFSISSRTREHTRSSRASDASTRQLRAHAKIADRHLTESYFQLQLQQHISQHFQCQPFTLSDLRLDSALSSLAQRLVIIRLQRRLASRSADASCSTSLNTTEQHPEKIRRLFEWAIRKMMQDGFVTLAEIDDSKALKAARKKDTTSTDVYRLVTPEYLLHPLKKLLGNSVSTLPCNAASHNAEELAARLRILDDRFRNITCSLVQDSLALYYARRAPIVID